MSISLLGQMMVPFAVVLVLLALAAGLLLAASRLGTTPVLVAILAGGPPAVWVIANTLLDGGPLNEFAQWVAVIRPVDWTLLLLVVGAFSAMIWTASDNVLVMLAFAPAALVAGLLTGWLLFLMNADLGLDLSRTGTLVAGATLGGMLATLALVGVLRSTPVRID